MLAVTGHRPDKLGGYSPTVARALTLFAEGELYRMEPDIVITGMALGWDQAIGWACHARRIPFWAYVPFDGQDSMWPPQARRQYAELLSYADKIVVCSSGGYEPYKMQVRNQRMIDDCQQVLALWNGTSGGTGNCLRYARAMKRDIHNCWSEWVRR